MMRRATLIIVWLVLSGSARAATVSLAWNPSVDPVMGYRVQYGAMSGVWTTTVVDVGNVTTTSLTLAPGTYFFAVVAYTATDTSGPSNEVTLAIAPIDTSCDYPLGSKAISIFVTALQKTGSGGAGSKARLDFQLASPNSPVTRVAVRTNGADLAAMTGADLAALAGLWFTVPAAPATYALSVAALNAYGCSREQSTTFTVTVK